MEHRDAPRTCTERCQIYEGRRPNSSICTIWTTRAASAASPANGLGGRATDIALSRTISGRSLKKSKRQTLSSLAPPSITGLRPVRPGAFLERLMFQYSVYDPQRSTLFGRKIRTGFIYTAGATEEMVQEMGFDRNVEGFRDGDGTDLRVVRVALGHRYTPVQRLFEVCFHAVQPGGEEETPGRSSFPRIVRRHTNLVHGWSGREREIFRSWCRHAL